MYMWVVGVDLNRCACNFRYVLAPEVDEQRGSDIFRWRSF